MKKRSMVEIEKRSMVKMKRRRCTHIIEKKNAEESHMQKMNSARKKKNESHINC